MYGDKLVKTFLKDSTFHKDVDPHKYAILYASKFYRVINPYLRDIESHTKRKYICRFYINFVNYFFEYGKKQSDIVKRCSKLYRGCPGLRPSPIVDKAFISTTEDLSVAMRFAKQDGVVITFKTSKLPTNVPYVIIDDSIAEYLFESEILFLPGIITVTKDLKAIYSPLPNVKEMCDQIGGGAADEFDITNLKIPKIDLRDKIVVWYRVIQGRDPDILDVRSLPKTHKGVEMMFRTTIFPHDAYLQDMRTYIPEYIDLRDKKGKTPAECEKVHSYMVHMAIYDPKNNNIDTINYGVFDEVFPEIFNVSMKDKVETTILKHFEKW